MVGVLNLFLCVCLVGNAVGFALSTKSNEAKIALLDLVGNNRTRPPQRKEVEALVEQLRTLRKPGSWIGTVNSVKGKWKVLWTSEDEVNIFVKLGLVKDRGEGAIQEVTQIIGDGTIANNIPFSGGGYLGVTGTCEKSSRVGRSEFAFTDAKLSLAWLRQGEPFDFPPLGIGWFDTIYCDSEISLHDNPNLQTKKSVKIPESMLTRLTKLTSRVAVSKREFSAFPLPKVFDYETITTNLTVSDAISSVEAAFEQLAHGKVDVPLPMHIGVDETENAGPGDCHIKGGYVIGTPTFTVKMAMVSFYKNLDKGLPPGAGIFVVNSAVNGAPLGVFQENRYMTDLRTGAAGGIAYKYFRSQTPGNDSVGFIGCGAIAKVMARAAAEIAPFKGVAFAPPGGGADEFAKDMEAELGLPFTVVDSAEALCNSSDVIYTQTPGSSPVLEAGWLKPHATIIASGSDQPTKNEIPAEVLAASKYVSDLTKQTLRVGELRSGVAAGVMTEDDVYAEMGEVVAGMKPGREGDELIVVDLTGTGAQDAAIGQVAWDKLSKL